MDWLVQWESGTIVNVFQGRRKSALGGRVCFVSVLGKRESRRRRGSGVNAWALKRKGPNVIADNCRCLKSTTSSRGEKSFFLCLCTLVGQSAEGAGVGIGCQTRVSETRAYSWGEGMTFRLLQIIEEQGGSREEGTYCFSFHPKLGETGACGWLSRGGGDYSGRRGQMVNAWRAHGGKTTFASVRTEMVAKDSLLSFSSTDVQKLHARGKVPFFSCSCKTTAPQEKRLLCVFVLGIMGSAHLQVSRVIFFLFFFFFWCDWKYFAAIIAACISRSISWIGLHSIFLACLET